MTDDQARTYADSHQENYRKALAQTVSDESFSDHGLIELTQTIGEDAHLELTASEGIKNVLLDTLNDEAFDHKHIDFYAADEESGFENQAISDSDDWDSEFDSHLRPIDGDSANERLVDGYIPGRYKVNALLGNGESGQVFAIQDNNLERNIAVKFMHPEQTDDFDKTQRFIDEAKTTGRLNHPGILPIHDLDFTDGALPFFTMRKVVALSLEEIIERSQINIHSSISSFIQRSHIMLDVCEAIIYAHQQGVVHGDIKPGNICVGNFGDTVLLDWKTSSTREQRGQEHKKLIGTPIYMSPEQARKEQCDELSDVYCLGSTLLHLLTLRLPLFHKNPSVFWELKKKGSYQAPTAAERKSIPLPLLAIAEKAMNAERGSRYPNVRAMRNDLLAYQSGNPVDAAKSAGGKHRQWQFVSIAALCLAALAVSLGIFFKAQQNKDTQQRSLQKIYTQNFDTATPALLSTEWQATYFPNKNPESIHQSPLNTADYWNVSDGSLRPRPPLSEQDGYNNITAQVNLQGNIRIQWECIGYRNKPSINAFFCGTNRFDAYTFEIGVMGSQDIKLLRSGIHVLSGSLDKVLEANTTYRMCMERDADYIRFSINDTLVLEYHDMLSLAGPGHQQFGFEGIEESNRLDNIEAWVQNPDAQIQRTAVADAYLCQGYPELALPIYNDLRLDYAHDKDLLDLTLIRSAMCLIALDHYAEACARLEHFLSSKPQHPYALSTHRLLTNTFMHLQRRDKLHTQLITLQTQYANNPSGQWLINSIANYLAETKSPTSTDIESNAHE